jgi:hypothetical protein
LSKFALPTVTLCAATSVNVEATVAALCASMEQLSFAEALLFTDRETALPAGIRPVAIEPLTSGADYSQFVLRRLGDHVATGHCLLVQWDGFVIDARQWDDEFLRFDYIGAPWPQFGDSHSVGNGGFSLRSRKLLEACQSADFIASHPEDVAIGRVNRQLLEEQYAIRFADKATASRFSFERAPRERRTFGFHGVFNMVDVLGPEEFWKIYGALDDRRTVFHDYRLLKRQLGKGSGGIGRQAKLALDRAADVLGF